MILPDRKEDTAKRNQKHQDKKNDINPKFHVGSSNPSYFITIEDIF